MSKVAGHIEDRQFHIEVLTPKQDVDDLDVALEKFAEKYSKTIDAGHIVTIPDNPMGNMHFNALETIPELELTISPELTIIHINTFHTRQELDSILEQCGSMGVKLLLIISGDGSERLPKLKPEDVDASVMSVTSVELLHYINRKYPGAFSCGVAFNPYEPQKHELQKLENKIEAGARFIVTQPVLGEDSNVLALKSYGLPIVVGAWMLKRLHLLSECVGYEIPKDAEYDPIDNLKQLSVIYEKCGFYLSMLGFKTQFPKLEEIWNK